MKRATMTIPDALAKAVDEYVNAQDTPPALTAVMQAAPREYLRKRGYWRDYRPLKIKETAGGLMSARSTTSTWRAVKSDAPFSRVI